MSNIVISNIYGKYNLGDLAIRNSALRVMNELFTDQTLTLLCEDLEGFPFEKGTVNLTEEFYSPYGFVIKSKTTTAQPVLIKLLRLIWVLVGTFVFAALGKLSPALLPSRGFFTYVTRIKTARVVFLMGGGYLVSRNHIKDTLGLLLNILPILVAKWFGKSVIILPISYGPYYNWVHSWLAGWAIKNTHLICRDLISLAKAQVCNPQAIFLPDLALYDWQPSAQRVSHRNQKDAYFVLTVKNYFNLNKQVAIEKEFADFISYVWKKHGLKCVFIPTGANPIEENDIPTGERLREKVGSKILKIEIPKTPEATHEIIKNARLAVCTRMHSAIFSAVVFTPFIAIAYEHKVKGLMELLKLKDWILPLDGITKSELISLFDKLTTARVHQKYVDQLKQDRSKILSQRQALKTYILANI